MGDQRSSRRGRPDYRSRGGIRNSLRNFPWNSRFWEKLQDHGDRCSHRRGRQDKANLSCRGLGGRDAAAVWRHLTDPPRGAREFVPTYRSLMIHYDPLEIERAELVRLTCQAIAATPVSTTQGAIWILPCCYEPPFAQDL